VRRAGEAYNTGDLDRAFSQLRRACRCESPNSRSPAGTRVRSLRVPARLFSYVPAAPGAPVISDRAPTDLAAVTPTRVGCNAPRRRPGPWLGTQIANVSSRQLASPSTLPLLRAYVQATLSGVVLIACSATRAAPMTRHGSRLGLLKQPARCVEQQPPRHLPRHEAVQLVVRPGVERGQEEPGRPPSE
jgi:hypothetical protein